MTSGNSCEVPRRDWAMLSKTSLYVGVGGNDVVPESFSMDSLQHIVSIEILDEIADRVPSLSCADYAASAGSVSPEPPGPHT